MTGKWSFNIHLGNNFNNTRHDDNQSCLVSLGSKLLVEKKKKESPPTLYLGMRDRGALTASRL